LDHDTRGDGGNVAVNPGNTNILYAENTGLSIKNSTNGGVSFASATSGITEPSYNFLFIAPFMMNPKSPLQLYTGGSYIWRSLNGGTSWTRATSFSNPFDVAYSSFAVAPTNPNRAAAGLSNGWIYLTDVALTSTESYQWPGRVPRGDAYVSSVAFDPTNDSIVYATFSTFNQVATNSHVYKTTDFGITWRGIDGFGDSAIPDVPVHSIVIESVQYCSLICRYRPWSVRIA